MKFFWTNILEKYTFRKVHRDRRAVDLLRTQHGDTFFLYSAVVPDPDQGQLQPDLR